MSLATSLEIAAAYQALAHCTKDHDEAVLAFLEKRPPSFTEQWASTCSLRADVEAAPASG